MLDPHGAAQDDANFQILDFQETLQKCIQDDQTVYGQKNKPRNEEPSMFNLLTWKDAETDNWNYTVKNKNIVESSLTNQLKYRINKSSSHWTTENMDQFRKFTYSPSKQPVFYDLADPANARVRLTTSQGPDASRNLVEQLARSSKGLHPHHQVPLEKASETADKYTVQNMRNLNDVLKVIEGRAINRAGEVVRNPVAQQVTERTRQSHPGAGHEEGGYYDEEYGYEGRPDDEEDSEQVEVEKMDLSNVKSRLLEKKVKTAKQLDPVYEKERLDRRKERIKRLNETTRWLPNSAFKTYFGKAPFENYGRGNINPTVGGSVYGDYLKSHNVNPHSGGNKPQYKQVYAHADFAATRYPDPQPEPPRKCKDDYRLSQNQVEELKRRNPLVGEKFGDEGPKTIVKPDLVNSLRFASEENTPDQSFEREKEKSKKPKNLRESLKQLGKKARAIRQENTKSKSVKSEKTKSATRSPDVLQSPQQSVYEESKKSAAPSAGTKKQASATIQPQSTKKVSATPQVTKKASQTQQQQQQQQPQRKTVRIEESDVVPQERSQVKLNQVAQREADLEEFRNTRAEPTKGQLEHEHYETIKAFNASQVGNLMRDPAHALQAQQRVNQTRVVQSPPQETRKAVSFKQAPAVEERSQQQLSYGKVEDLSTLIKEAQKNEKLIERINEDMGGTLNVNPMQPPKNYLFSLSQKETDPRYYKNVPSVWLQRIPFAGKKSEKHEDIKGVFGN